MSALADLPEFPADTADDDASGQAAARARVLEVLSGIFRPPAQPPGDDVPGPAAERQRRSWRDRSGRFARRPEMPVPEIDDVLSLADAADAAAPKVGGPVRAPGRDYTGEGLRAPRRAQRPAAEAPFTHKVSFPARTIPCDDPRRWRRAWRRAQGRSN